MDILIYVGVGLLGIALNAWIFALIFGVNKFKYYQAKQLALLAEIAKKQGLTETEVYDIMQQDV